MICRPAVGGGDKRVEVIEAAGWIVFGVVMDAAVRLLPHLVELMNGIARIGIIREIGTRQLERPVRQGSTLEDPWVGSSRAAGTGCTRGEQYKILSLQGRLDRRQEAVK